MKKKLQSTFIIDLKGTLNDNITDNIKNTFG